MVLGHFFRSKRVWFLLLATLTPSGITPAASNLDTGCLDESPLVLEKLGDVPLSYSPILLGEFQLPVASSHPEVLTHAKVRARVDQNIASGAWWVVLDFTFQDPQPFGIPFSFQRAEISWDTADGRRTSMLDWSEDCTGPGRSFYPGQHFSGSFEVKNSSEASALHGATFRLWGSRN